MSAPSDDPERPRWPALQDEQLSWHTLEDDGGTSRRARLAARGPYTAAVVPTIANTSVRVSPDVLADAAEAAVAIGRFDAELGSSVLPFASMLLRSESASSSQIENLTSGARAIAESELGERTSGNAALIVRNVRAMQAALALSDQIDEAAVIEMHEALLSDSAPEMTGRFRQQQVWIGGTEFSPHEAVFVPPHHGRVGDSMADLVGFVRRLDVPALAHAAIAHAQFETIHPFPDGNGRTGRALVHAMLRQAGVTKNIAVPVSAGLLHDLDGYYEALTAYRAGDVDAIVRAFTQAAWFAVASGRRLASDVRAVRASWADATSDLRSDNRARALVDLAIEHPVLNAGLIQDRLGVAAPTAYRAVETLVQRGVLRPANSKQRNRIWIAEALIEALEAFAARALRRGPAQRP